MSLLRAHGHPDAPHYTVGKIYTEANFVVRRIESERAQTVALMHAAMCATPNMGVDPSSTKKAWDEFAGTLRKMMGN